MVSAVVETSGEPSPKSQKYVSVLPASGSLLPAALRVVVSGAAPLAGLAPATALGGLFPAGLLYWMRRTWPPPA
jgi:hypothetical protein